MTKCSVLHFAGFWKTLVKTSLSNPAKSSLFLFFTLFIVGYFAIYRSHNWYIIYTILPEERGFLPDSKQETLSCTNLLKTARGMLNGERIYLPSSNGKTTLPFKQTMPKDLIRKSVKFGGNLNETIGEILDRKTFYNVNSSTIKASTMLITFGHHCCAFSKQRALSKAKSVGGFNYVHSFNFDSLSRRFRRTHHNLLKEKRGAGYWLWKPYILLKTLIEHMNEDDIVMYQDAGAYMIRNAGPLLKLCEHSKQGIVVFTLNKIESEYTKQDAFILMNMSFPEASESYQRLASFVVLRKSCTSIQFAMEWLAYASDRRIVTDDPNTMGVPNPPSFRDNRHDQSVLSLLSKKWALPAYRDPSQYGQFPPDCRYYSQGPYDQIFMHDRFKH